VVRGRIIRNLDEDRLRGALIAQLSPSTIPANARNIREGLPLRSRPRLRRASPPAAAPTPAAATPASASASASGHDGPAE
jgi:hypothetical protein